MRKFTPIFVSLVTTISLVFASACTRKQEDGTPQPQSTEAAKSKTLNVFTWSNYFNPEVVSKFENKTGMKVNFSYFSSNEELLTKMQAGARGYDVIVPSGYVVKAMISLGLLLPLEGSSWSEFKNLLPKFQSPAYDPSHEYVAPFAWGTTGLAVNTAKLNAKVDSWAFVFDHPELKGQITMLDDPPDVVGSALKYLGYSANERSPEALEKAKALLKKQKPLLKAYTSETLPLLESGDITIAQAYSSDVAQVMQKNPNITFVNPKEGGVVWVDNLAIPKGAENIQGAREFIRYLLNPEVAALQVAHVRTNPVVRLGEGSDTLKALAKANVYLNEKQLQKYEFTSDDPEFHSAVVKLWTELKAD